MTRLLKAMGIAAMIMFSVFLALMLLVWTKGLFFLIVIFCAVVYWVNDWLKYRERTMRKGDRGFL